MKKLVLALMLISFTSAQAGLLVEPYIGYGSIATTTDVPNADDDREGGSFVGGRLGYSFLLFSAGLDYNTGKADEYSRTESSAFVGFDLPILFRFYAKHIFASELKNDDFDFDFKEGYALGVGFTGLPFVVLNVEAGKQVYEAKYEGDNYDIDAASLLLTVSLPLDF